MTAAAAWRRRGPAVLAALALAPLATITSAEPHCPADGAARLGRSREAWLAAAAEALGSPASRCREKGRLLADLLDAPSSVICPPPSSGGGGDADRLALTAAIAWRCGRPREAFAAARAALRSDPRAALAWRLVGEVWAARIRPEQAETAFRRALAIDPEDPRSLWQLANVAATRAERRKLLERFLAAAPARGTRPALIRAASEQIALLDALGTRPLWKRVRAALPAEIKLTPVVPRVGQISALLLRAGIGGRKRLPLLLDSGASGLHLDARAGRSAGVTPLAGGTLVGGGGRRAHAVTRGVVPSVDLGPLAYEDALGVVAAGDLHPQGRYRGIVGLDVFGGLVATIDASRGRIALGEAGSGEPTAGGPLEADPWPADPDLVPLLRVEGQLLVPARVESGREARDLLLLVDTGASRSLLTLAGAAGLPGLRLGGSGRLSAYGGARAVQGRLPRAALSIGGRTFPLEDLPVVAMPERETMTGVRTGGFVGLDLLARQPFEIDLARGTLRFLPD